MLYELKNDEMLYFLHITKTGGTTLKKILDSQFKPNAIFKAEVYHDLLLTNDWDFSKSCLIRGHFGLGMYRLLPKKPVYITMLRDPVERTISWYHHLMRNTLGKHPRLIKLFDGNEILYDLLLHPVFKRFFKNVQVRYLSLDLDFVSLVQYLADMGNDTRFELSQYRSIYGSNNQTVIPNLELPFSKLANRFSGQILDDFLNWPSIEGIELYDSEEKLLEEVAKKNLTKMPFFGIQEQYDDSVAMLLQTFGWEPIKEIPREMVGNYPPDNFPEYVLKQIKLITKSDNEIYKFGKKLFYERYNAN